MFFTYFAGVQGSHGQLNLIYTMMDIAKFSDNLSDLSFVLKKTNIIVGSLMPLF